MKKIVFGAITALLMVACSSNTPKPAGNGEADGKKFAKEILAAYKADDVDKMEDVVDTYYEFYKDQDPKVIKQFFDSWLVEFHNMGSDPNLINDFEKFQRMTYQADKDNKLNDLYDEVMK